MKPATEFYIKDRVDNWLYSKDKTFLEHLEKNKFYVEGYWKNKAFNVIMWILKKLDLKCLNVYAEDRVMVYKKYRLDQHDLGNLIEKYRIDVEYIWHEKPRYLVIGQDVFDNLFNEKAEAFGYVDTEFQFYVDTPYYDPYDAYNERPQQMRREIMFHGLRILIVPWINGCFLLPNI